MLATSINKPYPTKHKTQGSHTTMSLGLDSLLRHELDIYDIRRLFKITHIFITNQKYLTKLFTNPKIFKLNRDYNRLNP